MLSGVGEFAKPFEFQIGGKIIRRSAHDAGGFGGDRICVFCGLEGNACGSVPLPEPGGLAEGGVDDGRAPCAKHTQRTICVRCEGLFKQAFEALEGIDQVLGLVFDVISEEVFELYLEVGFDLGMGERAGDGEVEGEAAAAVGEALHDQL